MSISASFLLVLMLSTMVVDSKPFFDAIYDALNGRSHRSYGYEPSEYSGYNGYGGYNGYNGYNEYNGYNGNGRYKGYNGNGGYKAPRGRSLPTVIVGKTYGEICRVHNPIGVPGSMPCPWN